MLITQIKPWSPVRDASVQAFATRYVAAYGERVSIGLGLPADVTSASLTLVERLREQARHRGMSDLDLAKRTRLDPVWVKLLFANALRQHEILDDDAHRAISALAEALDMPLAGLSDLWGANVEEGNELRAAGFAVAWRTVKEFFGQLSPSFVRLTPALNHRSSGVAAERRTTDIAADALRTVLLLDPATDEKGTLEMALRVNPAGELWLHGGWVDGGSHDLSVVEVTLMSAGETLYEGRFDASGELLLGQHALNPDATFLNVAVR